MGGKANALHVMHMQSRLGSLVICKYALPVCTGPSDTSGIQKKKHHIFYNQPLFISLLCMNIYIHATGTAIIFFIPHVLHGIESGLLSVGCTSMTDLAAPPSSTWPSLNLTSELAFWGILEGWIKGLTLTDPGTQEAGIWLYGTTLAPQVPVHGLG